MLILKQETGYLERQPDYSESIGLGEVHWIFGFTSNQHHTHWIGADRKGKIEKIELRRQRL